MEQAVHDRGAARVGQKLALIADEAARRRMEDEPQAVAARRAHLDHLGLALGHLLHDDAGMLLVDVDHDLFDRLQQRAVLGLLEHHLRPRHAEFETFASHRLDQDRELQFAAPGDDIGIGACRILDAQGDIALGLFVKPGADDAARHLVALRAGQRRIIDERRSWTASADRSAAPAGARRPRARRAYRRR